MKESVILLVHEDLKYIFMHCECLCCVMSVVGLLLHCVLVD